MADFVPCPDVGEFAVVQRQAGENVINVFHLKKEGGWDSASLADASVALMSCYNDHFAAQQSTDLQYILVRARDLTTSDGAIAITNFPPSSGGDDSATASPNYVSFSVSHSTGFAGRSRRGRTAFGGIPANKAYNGDTGDVYRQAWLNAVDAADALLLAEGYTWGVLSRYSGYTQPAPSYKKVPTPRAEGLFTDINDHQADTRTDIQSSRKLGTGS